VIGVKLPTGARGLAEVRNWFSARTGGSRVALGMLAAIVVLHLAGWITLIAVVVPQHLAMGPKVFGLGIGVTAYLLGVRHAFDADHIAAIDNVTRGLMRGGKRPFSVGFWFSIGHSSVVFALTALLAFGGWEIAGPLLDDGSKLHAITGVTGTVVSASFLFAIAAFNMLAFSDVWRKSRRICSPNQDQAALNRPALGGPMNRLLRPLARLVAKPWQMFFVGLAFGLGFDTVTEIALLVLSGTGAASGLPWYAVLSLPILFAAEMSLFDALDGSLMCVAYGSGGSDHGEKVYYNLLMIGLSVGGIMSCLFAPTPIGSPTL
jgi:nickel/cobalt transporter (NiCoT) family protein